MDRFGEEEIKAVELVIRSEKLSPFFSSWLGGAQVQAFESEFAEYIGVKHAITVCNGTISLEIALRALGIGKGDEVITTPLSFVATGTAILTVGATPVFVDVERDTLNLNPDLVSQAVTSRTKAILPVSLCGIPAKIDQLQKHGFPILHDCAQALGSVYKGKKVGSQATISSFSLQETKSITSAGEGGVIVTNDDRLAERCRNIRNHGNIYGTADYLCGNYRLTEIQAAFARVQLAKWKQYLEERQYRNAKYFMDHLPNGLEPIFIHRYIYENDMHPSWLLIPTRLAADIKISREDFIEKMMKAGINQGIPGQNVGYYRQLISDVEVFRGYKFLSINSNARWLLDHIILWDIHRFNHTIRDMKNYIQLIEEVLNKS